MRHAMNKERTNVTDSTLHVLMSGFFTLPANQLHKTINLKEAEAAEASNCHACKRKYETYLPIQYDVLQDGLDDDMSVL